LPSFVSLIFAHLASRAFANAFSFASLNCFFLGFCAGSINGAVPLILAHLAF
jgi:hypothetical protein